MQVQNNTHRQLKAQRTSPSEIKIQRLFILGNHIQALGVSRMAAAIGLEVTIFNGYGASVARFSNTCKHFILYKDKAHLLQMLLNESRERDTLLVATNDNLIGFMADHYDILAEKYYLSIPTPDVVDICYNKRLTYQKAMDLGIPIPTSYFPDTLEEVMELADQITYPIIIKPAVMHTFHSATGKKVFFCKDKTDLLNNYREIIKIIPPEEVIIQQFLTGGAKQLYSYGSFFAEGQAYGSFIANRIRQKPMDFGISTCFAHTVLNPEIEKLSVEFLKAIDYFGMSEVEFMYDEKTNEYKLIEINPRSWKWHSLANKLGINLFQMMVSYLEQKSIEVKHNQQANIAWIERVTDTYVVVKEIIKGRMSLADYRKTMQMPKESATWSWRDPFPAIMYVLMTPILWWKR
ncbi:MAG: ATP-grasp domain-containing protein [Saprospiraceae bacterium]